MPNFTKLRKNVVIYDEIEGAKSKPRFIPRGSFYNLKLLRPHWDIRCERYQ